MKRNNALKIINPFLAVLFVNQVVTVLFRSMLSFESFMFLHRTGGGILLGLILVHILLNFNWVRATYLKK